MADSVPVGDLAAAVSNALHDDRARLGAMVARAKQRTEQRALDSAMPRAPDAAPIQPTPEPVARAIRRLSRSNERLEKQTAALQAQADEALLGLVNALVVLRRKVRDVARGREVQARGAAALARRRAAEASLRRQIVSRRSARAQEARLVAARTEIQKVTNIVNSLQAAAYAEKGSVLAPNNLLLVANQLFWDFLDPALERLGAIDAGSATVLSAFAPLGSLISGAVLVGNPKKRPHV